MSVVAIQVDRLLLDVEIGLGPDHIVLDGDPAPPTNDTVPPVFGPCLLGRDGRMDKDTTW